MLYKVALFIHILGAISLFVGVSIVLVSMLGMRRAKTVEAFREWSALVSSSGKIMPGAALLLIISGIYMLLTVWHWQTAWADVALASVLLIFVLGPTFIGPRLMALHNAASIAPDGRVPRPLRLQTLDPILWTMVYVLTTIALGILLLMIGKPTLVGAIITIGIAIILGPACALPIWQAKQAFKDVTQQQTEKIEQP